MPRRHAQPALAAAPLMGDGSLTGHIRPHVMNPSMSVQMTPPSEANNVVPPPANLIITQSRYSKRAFLNGLEAVKTIIRRNTENKEEFIANKVSSAIVALYSKHSILRDLLYQYQSLHEKWKSFC